MKILVVGGSYFYGRVFVMLASETHDVTVVNRGAYSMEEFGVRQIKGDRHDGAVWRQFREEFDALVDFCAYQQGDIRTVLENFEGSVKQYIFISTVDVYRRGTGTVKEETAPFETRVFPGEAGEYIAGKAALERELEEECGARGIAFTVLRPAILFGPYNYAPRESLFIQMAVQSRVLPKYTDADGRFQLVYVKDAAEAVLRCLLKEETFGQAYNLCGDETVDYDLFFEELRSAAADEAARAEKEAAEGEAVQEKPSGQEEKMLLREAPLTLGEALARGLPVPFPATAAETELVSNEKSRRELGLEYTSLKEGMRKTFRAFKNVYSP